MPLCDDPALHRACIQKLPPFSPPPLYTLTRCSLINNSRETYRFPFDGLLPPGATQGEVYDAVAAPVLRAALDGYNGTVFAFGQTGSGKTFSITGGAERYADRGIIPRAISAAFAEAARRSSGGGGSAASHASISTSISTSTSTITSSSSSSTTTYTLSVSYMQIYNESGYDLLQQAPPGREGEVRALEDLPRVSGGGGGRVGTGWGAGKVGGRGR